MATSSNHPRLGACHPARVPRRVGLRTVVGAVDNTSPGSAAVSTLLGWPGVMHEHIVLPGVDRDTMALFAALGDRRSASGREETGSADHAAIAQNIVPPCPVLTRSAHLRSASEARALASISALGAGGATHPGSSPGVRMTGSRCRPTAPP